LLVSIGESPRRVSPSKVVSKSPWTQAKLHRKAVPMAFATSLGRKTKRINNRLPVLMSTPVLRSPYARKEAPDWPGAKPAGLYVARSLLDRANAEHAVPNPGIEPSEPSLHELPCLIPNLTHRFHVFYGNEARNRPAKAISWFSCLGTSRFRRWSSNSGGGEVTCTTA
jgi:hypothetical protein